jgi:CRISPR-associated endonuclease/helicase Cas3
MIQLPWGKLDGDASHHLAHHCADVSACFEAMAALPVIRARLESAAGRTLTEVDMSRLALIAFLHDSGKLHPGFQAKCGWSYNIWPNAPHGHVQEGAAIFLYDGNITRRIAQNLHFNAFKRWCDADLLTAALAHHGRPFMQTGQIEPKAKKFWEPVANAGYDPLVASAEIGSLLPEWFAPAFQDGGGPLPDKPAFQHLFCGLVSLADWLGSTQTIFEFCAESDRGYMTKARGLARRAVADIGLDVARLLEAVQGKAEFSIISPGNAPRGAQALVGKWSLDDQLIILEAETGSGKTEAALWRFAKLFEAGKVDSLYFALPTRAAAKHIHGRVNATMKSLFGDNAPEAVLAVPGYIKAGDVMARSLPDYKVLWEDRPDEKARLGRWAAESTKRFLAATVAVGTVDQVMLASMQVKHAHLRAAALSRSFLVIDEVHASDRYMGAIQKNLLSMHLSIGGHAMLMSATLGAEARTVWLSGNRKEREAAPNFTDAVAAPYPAVWSRDAGCRAANDSSGRIKPVTMELALSWTPQEAASRAISAATAGAKVLVIRNTVGMAAETFAAVKAAGAETLLWQVAGGPALHHARFAPEDRELLDNSVERALHRNGHERPAGGVIVIGSQTLEQSLDICADILITDLCPADVLLQRMGRLHRHALVRPAGFETPRCVVLSPEGGLDRFVAPAFENGLGRFRDGGGIYPHLHACELTRRLVIEHATWAIPAMNRLLVEGALHIEKVEALSAEKGAAWDNYWNGIYGKDIADAQSAKNFLLPVKKAFSDLSPFASDEEKLRTRLGAEGARIAFDRKVTSPFGQMISGITMPGHWKGIVAVDPVPVRQNGGVVEFEVGEQAFSYDREGLKRNLENNDKLLA